MNDAFCELLVPRKRQIKDVLICVLVLAAIGLLTLVGMNFIGMTAVLIGALLVYLAYHYLLGGLMTSEYEYYLLNNELDITIIHNRATRKDLLSIDIRAAEIIAPAGSHRLGQYRNAKVMDFTSGYGKDNVYSIIISMDQGLKNILFEPDEAIVEQMRQWAPSKTFTD